jgi:ubiquinone biosynthesis protein COQ9
VTDPADLTLPELALELAPAVAQAAVFDGWSDAAVASAAEAIGIDPAAARLAFPRGAIDMVLAWTRRIDADMAAAVPAATLAALPIRERIRRLVQFRLDAAGNREALRRALAVLAMPQHAAEAAKAGWHAADAMWRLAGDTATDYNHYTKRAILGGIYAATLAVHAFDVSEGGADTRAFLNRRIDGVMKFEKAKARLLDPDRPQFSMARFLGRLRYPAR